MNLSTHRATHRDPHARAGVWSIALIIIVSALLAVLIEPLFPTPVLTAHGDTAHTAQAAADVHRTNQ